MEVKRQHLWKDQGDEFGIQDVYFSAQACAGIHSEQILSSGRDCLAVEKA